MKGTLIIAVLSALVLAAAADYGEWSEWSPCLCQRVRVRSRTCLADPCVGDEAESQQCTCTPTNPPIDCPMVHGANSVDGLLADNCNCSNYVQCVRDQKTDEFTGIFRSCNPCEIWDQDLLTCVSDTSKLNCVFQPSTEATGPCPLSEIEGDEFKFMLGNDTIMDCAPGTKFNLSVCTCIHYDPGVPEFDSITCLKFNGNFDATKGLWLYNWGVVLKEGGVDGECAFFASTNKSKLELPYFSNALDKFSQFALSLWFKRPSGLSGVQSLVDNSDCSNSASVRLTSGAGDMTGEIRTDGDDYASLFAGQISKDMEASFNSAASDNNWHHYVMSYNGSFVTFYLDKVEIGSKYLIGRPNRVKASMFMGGCACGGSCFFDGYMDTISFLRVALSPEEVDYLYSNPKECVPAIEP